MKRLALLTLVAMLALPAAALARTFPARVVHATPNALTLRLADGRVVRYASPRPASAAPRPLLAHAARDAAAADVSFNLAALAPGVTVLVSASPGGVTIGLPGPGAPEQRASGVVRAVAPGSFVLELADHTQLRLQGAGVHPCETASVAYHQDLVLLVADSVRAAGRRAAHCSGRGRAAHAGYVQRLASGTVSAASEGTVTIISAASGARVTFATSASVVAGDHVVIVYHRASGRPVADAVYAQAD